jgi:hypothetical protein
MSLSMIQARDSLAISLDVIDVVEAVICLSTVMWSMEYVSSVEVKVWF